MWHVPLEQDLSQLCANPWRTIARLDQEHQSAGLLAYSRRHHSLRGLAMAMAFDLPGGRLWQSLGLDPARSSCFAHFCPNYHTRMALQQAGSLLLEQRRLFCFACPSLSSPSNQKWRAAEAAMRGMALRQKQGIKLSGKTSSPKLRNPSGILLV